MDVKEVQELIIEGGRAERRPKLDFFSATRYPGLTSMHTLGLPSGAENRRLFLKGFLLLENSSVPGTAIWFLLFMERLDGYQDEELMDWIFSHRNNEYIPYSEGVPLEIKSMQQYRDYRREINARAQNKREIDAEQARINAEQSRIDAKRRAFELNEHVVRSAATRAQREAELIRLGNLSGVERVIAIAYSRLPLAAIPAEYIPETRHHVGSLSAAALRKFWEKAKRINRKSPWRVLRPD